MTLTKSEIQNISLENLAAWIEGLQDILKEARDHGDLVGEGAEWVDVHFEMLQSLPESRDLAAWKKCPCGRDLFAPISQAYVSVRDGDMTIQCACGKVRNIRFTITEEPRELPF